MENCNDKRIGRRTGGVALIIELCASAVKLITNGLIFSRNIETRRIIYRALVETDTHV